VKEQFRKLRTNVDTSKDKWLKERLLLEQRLQKFESAFQLKTKELDAQLSLHREEKLANKLTQETLQSQLRDKRTQLEQQTALTQELEKQIKEIEVKKIEASEGTDIHMKEAQAHAVALKVSAEKDFLSVDGCSLRCQLGREIASGNGASEGRNLPPAIGVKCEKTSRD
jgi:hypothetical protein